MAKGRKPKCPYCGSTQNRSKGFRTTVTMGRRPIRQCLSCKRRFTLKAPARRRASRQSK